MPALSVPLSSPSLCPRPRKPASGDCGRRTTPGSRRSSPELSESGDGSRRNATWAAICCVSYGLDRLKRDRVGKASPAPLSMIAGPANAGYENTGPEHVTVPGETDANSALAQLASARYASESTTPGTPTPRNPESLTVLTSLAEARAAVNKAAGSAQRLI